MSYLIGDVDAGFMLNQFPDNLHTSFLGCNHEHCLLRGLKTVTTGFQLVQPAINLRQLLIQLDESHVHQQDCISLRFS